MPAARNYVTPIYMARLAWEECQRVFVYGTLKSDHWNNRLLSTSTLIGEATTVDNYVLSGSGVPFLIPSFCVPVDVSAPLLPVRGEVWEVDSLDTMVSLDNLEGHPYGYYRNMINTDLGPAWAYHILDTLEERDFLNPVVNGAYEFESFPTYQIKAKG